jgi:hypothetical protein
MTSNLGSTWADAPTISSDASGYGVGSYNLKTNTLVAHDGKDWQVLGSYPTGTFIELFPNLVHTDGNHLFRIK